MKWKLTKSGQIANESELKVEPRYKSLTGQIVQKRLTFPSNPSECKTNERTNNDWVAHSQIWMAVIIIHWINRLWIERNKWKANIKAQQMSIDSPTGKMTQKRQPIVGFNQHRHFVRWLMNETHLQIAITLYVKMVVEIPKGSWFKFFQTYWICVDWRANAVHKPKQPRKNQKLNCKLRLATNPFHWWKCIAMCSLVVTSESAASRMWF